MADRDYRSNDEHDRGRDRDMRADSRPRRLSRDDYDRQMDVEANRGYRGGHMSGGAMGNRGMSGSGFLGPIHLGNDLIGGGNASGYGAGALWNNFDAEMDGYSGTMGDDTDLVGYSGRVGAIDARRPNFAGRGSKNYRRSDVRIEEDVHEALMRDPYLDATDVDVSVKDGEVTLSGEVTDRQARRRAEECVETCPGVRDVHNNLKARNGLRGASADRTAEERDVTARPKRER
jgi:hypothetical protein